MRRAGLILLLLLAPGCEPGDGSTLDDGGRIKAHPYAPSLGSRYGAVTFPATYSGVSQVFFAQFCTGCHSGSSPARGLNLSPAVAYEQMVKRASAQRSALSLVEPDDAASSYIVRKIAGGPNIVGRRMPRGRPARPQEEIDIIRQWIDEGAAKD